MNFVESLLTQVRIPLWLRRTNDGRTFMSGPFGKLQIFLNKNEHKEEGSKQPDYYASFRPDQRQEMTGFANNGQSAPAPSPMPEPGFGGNEEIPF